MPYAQDVYSLSKKTAANMPMLWPVGMACGCFFISLASDRALLSYS
ncbi:MAG TPA: hypothetical protein PK728_02930 [Bacillota bacterium]|nr:hypothetical protein [Bacillota bacterium]